MNRAPDFGRLGDNLYYLQGFSGHGVALTGLAGQLVVAQAWTGSGVRRFDLFAASSTTSFPVVRCCARPVWCWACCFTG